MCSWADGRAWVRAALVAWVLGGTVSPAAAQRFPGIGRQATAAEVAAWDIDVRADFKGLPPGSGSVAQGQVVWEARCAACHGYFGESNEVFTPIAGGTTAQDIATGRVANLRRTDYPGRTTLMKLSSLATLWDYTRRAMPWNQPKSLSNDEVYAVTAYMLHLGGIVPERFVLSDGNMREVEQRLPNRHGKTTAHALWPGREFGPPRPPDVRARACMRDCPAEPGLASVLPDFARDAHGNLAEQNRGVGPQRGADTSRPAPTVQAAALAGSPAPRPAPATRQMPVDLLQKHSCTACHASEQRLVGPGWAEIARKHPGKAEYLAEKIRAGGVGVWGSVPMPPQAIASGDAQRVAQWLASGAPP